MRAHPFLVAGTGRADTAIMENAPNVIAKVGAEALFCAAILDRGLGVAVKIADGGDRASGPALVGALRALDAIDDERRSRIDEVARRPLLGGGEPVGELVVEIALTRA
jgi:L-asparaginase II